MSTPTHGTDSRRAGKLAYHAIYSLRDGDPQPHLLDATAPGADYGLCADYGPWAATIANLAFAYTAGGAPAVEHAYTLALAGRPRALPPYGLLRRLGPHGRHPWPPPPVRQDGRHAQGDRPRRGGTGAA
jgi:hypothetical protein